MGIESSSQKNGGASLFLDPELSSAYEQLQTDRTMAYEFIAFFKSGEWLEDVAEYEPTGIRTMTHEERLAKEKKSPLYEYKPEHGKLRKFDELFVGNKSLRLSRRSSLSGISRSISQQRRIFYGDVEGSFAAHVDVAKCCYFEPGHLRAIMLHLALSHFLNSPLYSKYRVAPCSSSSICDESTWAESSYFSVSSRGSNTPSCRPSRPASAKQVPEPADNSIPKLLTTSAWHLQNSLIESGLLLDDAEILLETLQITPAAGTGTATVMPDLQQQAQQKSILHSAESLLYEALDQHPLGITICEIVDEGTAVDENATSSSSSFIGKDTNTAAAAVAEATSISSGSKPRCPVIIYANAAYARTTGYSRKELIGKPFSFIQGAHTDIDQLQNVRTAMCTGQRHKAALTCHGKYGREFLDLIAMRPLYINPVHRVSRQRTSTSTGGGGTSSTSTKSVLDPPPPAAAAAAAGRYCVRVHCSATADGAMQDLAVVDDLLMLITHLVVAPQLPSAAATTAASGRCEEDRTCSGTGSTSRHRGSGSSSIAGLLSSSIQSLKRSSRSSNHNNDNETIVRAKKPSSGFLQMRGNSRKQIQPSG